MKSTIATFALYAALLLPTGCADGVTTPARSVPPGTMSAKINGRSWTSSTLLASGYRSPRLTLQGVRLAGGSAEQISITLKNVAGANSYALGDERSADANGASVLTTAPQGSGRTLEHNAGTVTITRLTPDGVEGTFDFKAGSDGKPAAYAVTDGIFNARFQ